MREKTISIKVKITVALFLIMLCLLFVAGTCITYQYNQKITKRSEQHIEENLRIMSERVASIFKNGNLCANYLALSINRIINEEGIRGIALENRLRTECNQDVLIFEEIHSIVYITKNGQMYTTDVLLQENEEKIKSSSYIKELEKCTGRTQLFDLDTTCMYQNESENMITMGKRVNNVITGKTEGYLFLNIEASYLSSSVENSISSYFLFDKKGNQMKGSEKQHLSKEWIAKLSLEKSQLVEHDKKHYAIAKNQIEGYGWTIAGITDLNKFNLSASERGVILMQNGIVILFVVFIVGSVVTKLITRPLEELTEGAKNLAKGNMDVKFEIYTKDEIGTLASVFQFMTIQIKELLERVNEEAKKKRQYELALIQEQVKPHFLYNTLDIIIMLIDMKRHRDAQRVTKKLADYYKISLSGSEEIISLRKEIEMIEDYLELQRMRYGEKFTYEFEITQDILDVSIPKMTLQPLIENAIYHGLKYKEEWGNIWIRGKRNKEQVIIQVEDNGIGIMAEELEQVRCLSEQAKKHFGIYSVGHRLELYFGETYGITLDSEYEKGTIVTIRIPYQEGEQGND